MESIHVAAALLSAVLHAGWNAAVKASPRPAEAMAAQMLMSAVLSLPFLLWTGLPDTAAWKWVAASTLTNTVVVTALLKAYETAGFGIVYPVVRAMSVVLVVPMAALLAGDHLGLAGLAGVGLIVLSLGILGFSTGRDRSVPPPDAGYSPPRGPDRAHSVLSASDSKRRADPRPPRRAIDRHPVWP